MFKILGCLKFVSSDEKLYDADKASFYLYLSVQCLPGTGVSRDFQPHYLLLADRTRVDSKLCFFLHRWAQKNNSDLNSFRSTQTLLINYPWKSIKIKMCNNKQTETSNYTGISQSALMRPFRIIGVASFSSTKSEKPRFLLTLLHHQMPT